MSNESAKTVPPGDWAPPVARASASRAARMHIRLPVPLLLLVPATIVLVLFFVIPMGALLVGSFYDYSRLGGIIHTFTWKNYLAVFTDPYNLRIILRTLRLGLLTSVTTLVLGYPIALYLTIAPSRQRALIILMVLSPLLVSVVVRTFGWLIILGPNGLLDTALRSVGITIAPILHTELAVVIGLANVLLPFLVLSVATSLQSIDPAVSLAASSLGASAARVFWHVTLPLTLPGIVSGLLIVFSLASSSFVTPSLLGGSNYSVLSTTVYEQAMVMQNWPSASSFAVALALIVFLILLVQTRLVEGGKFKVVFH